MNINGLLLVDKPIGWTSFDAVNKVRGAVARGLNVKPRTVKVGHSGTLDPMATGLLVLAIGRATKSMSSLTKLDKVYEVQAMLGATSDTGDSEGQISVMSSPEQPNAQAVRAALESFIGDIEQIPPKYSAIKVDGVRAYKRARKGEDFKLEPRKVKIYQIDELKYKWPNLSFTTKVSSGTYIRSLVEDVGETLGSGAYMSQLRRTRVGEYDINEAVDVDQLDYEEIVKSISPLD